MRQCRLGQGRRLIGWGKRGQAIEIQTTWPCTYFQQNKQHKVPARKLSTTTLVRVLVDVRKRLEAEGRRYPKPFCNTSQRLHTTVAWKFTEFTYFLGNFWNSFFSLFYITWIDGNRYLCKSVPFVSARLGQKHKHDRGPRRSDNVRLPLLLKGQIKDQIFSFTSVSHLSSNVQQIHRLHKLGKNGQMYQHWAWLDGLVSDFYGTVYSDEERFGDSWSCGWAREHIMGQLE